MGLAKRREDRRLMLFEDTYSMWTERRLTQAQAAELLGVASGRSGAGWSDTAETKAMVSRPCGIVVFRAPRTARRRWTR